MVGNADAAEVSTLLRWHATERPEQDAVLLVADPDDVTTATSLSYAELDAESLRIASWLRQRCEPGDRVLLVYPVGLRFVASFLGCLHAGMIAVPAPLPGRYRHERRRVLRIAEDAGIGVALTDSENLAALREWAVEMEPPGVECVASDVLPSTPESWSPAGITPETIALLQYTSGSTGDPKGVMVSHRNLLSNTDSLIRTFGFDATTCTGGWLPLYHDMGLMAQLLPVLFAGGSCVLMNPMAFLKRPVSWLRLIDEYDVKWSAAPNFAYDHCRRRVTDEQLSSLDLSRWRFAANGSEPVRASTLTAFAERFARAGFRESAFSPCFGLAESTVFVSGGRTTLPYIRQVDEEALRRNIVAPSTERPARNIVSCGPPGDVEVRIVDPETREFLDGQRIGEVWLRGRSIAHGYWRNETATNETFRAHTVDGDGPFLRTGDLGVVLDGELYVTGRIKEMVTIRGRNLYPQDIEHELSITHERLAGQVGAAFTVPAADGESEALVVVHEVKGRADEQEWSALSSAMKQTVSREFGVPAQGVVLLRPGGVRRTTSGKIERTAMRELFLTDALPSVFADSASRALAPDPHEVAVG